MPDLDLDGDAAVHQAAIFLPLRYSEGKFEVLTGQNEVYNFLRNEASDIGTWIERISPLARITPPPPDPTPTLITA